MHVYTHTPNNMYACMYTYIQTPTHMYTRLSKCFVKYFYTLFSCNETKG